MRRRYLPSRSGLLGLILLALVAAGCANAAPSSPPGTSTATPARLTITVLREAVARSAKSGPPAELPSDNSVDLQVQDHVAVDDKGRALIRLANQLNVELMSGTQMDVTDLRQNSDGTNLVEFKLTSGNSLVQLATGAKAGVTVVTDYARLTPGGENAQLLLCHSPGILTCVVVVNGEARVEGNGQTVTVRSNEGTFVLPGQAPHAPICAHIREVRLWLQRARSTNDAGDLGSMVVDWPNKQCPEITGAGNPVAASPESDTRQPASPTAALAGTGGGRGQGRAITPVATSANVATPVPSSTPEPSATSAPTATAAPTATSTPQPTVPPTESSPPDKDMVRIPAGHYVVGTDETDQNHIGRLEVDLREYWIDAYEVTNAQYKLFLDSTGRPAPQGWTQGKIPSGHDLHPAAGLTWDDATAYCAWAGKRLPGEAEWEAAGRGPGPAPALYPWGADPTADGKSDALPKRDTYPVGSFAFNKSPFGAYDMTGNVWQWVGEPYEPVPDGFHVLRGGRHGLLEDMAFRQPAKPDDDRFTRVAGVRCAADRVAGE